MSFNGLEKLRMGYVPPRPPPQLPLLPDGNLPPIDITDGATFDKWMQLPAEDLRTLAEFAMNPVPLVRRKPAPPPAPPRARTAEMMDTRGRPLVLPADPHYLRDEYGQPINSLEVVNDRRRQVGLRELTKHEYSGLHLPAACLHGVPWDDCPDCRH